MTVPLAHPTPPSSAHSRRVWQADPEARRKFFITKSPRLLRARGRMVARLAAIRGTRPIDFLSSRSRIARRLHPADWTVKSRLETVARGLHARRRGQKDKWGRKKRAFFLGNYSRSFERANRLRTFVRILLWPLKQMAGLHQALPDTERKHSGIIELLSCS